jgi:hypothetical protein
MELHRLDCTSSHRRMDAYDFVSRLLTETPPEQIRPSKLLTGDSLREMGYQPGPIFSQILTSVEDAQLEGKVSTQEEARRYVRSKFGPNSPEKSQEVEPFADRDGRVIRRDGPH